jgi:hypothetical protein
VIEIEEPEPAGLVLPPAWLAGSRLSPTSTVNSIWGSQSSIQSSSFQSLDARVADMRRPTYVPDTYRASTPPPAGNEVQLGVTNRGAINHVPVSDAQRTISPQAISGQLGVTGRGAIKNASVSDAQRTISPQANSGQLGVANRGGINHAPVSDAQRTISPQATSGQPQDTQAQKGRSSTTQHARFPSFNPARPAGANFPEYVAAGQGQKAPELKQSSTNQTQQHIHAPQPSVFKPSHAFRELATPTPEAASGQQQPTNVQQPAPIQRPVPASVNPPTRSLMSPVHLERPSAVPTMPSAMRNMGQAAPPMRGPLPHRFQNGFNQSFTGGGQLTNGTHFNSFNMHAPHQHGSHMSGFQTNGFQMNGYNMNRPHMSAPQYNGGQFQNPQMYGSQMGRLPMHGQQVNPQQMYNQMPGYMPNQRMPAMPLQADPFVDARSPVYANARFAAPANMYQPFAAAPQPGPPAPVSSPISNAGAGYSWDRSSQTNNHVNGIQQPQANVTQQPQPNVSQQPETQVAQQPQTHAARMADAIRAGVFHQDGRAPRHGRGLISPGGESPGNELVVQPPVVRSQAVLAPEMRPDPAWVDPNDRVLPNLDDVYEHMPFVDTAAESRPCTNGVIKIGNIPYGTTKNEVIAALGRATRIASQPRGTAYLAIHIIMERSTGKTMDCYVELDTVDEAKLAIAGFYQRCDNNRHPRIGDRHVEIELSSQEALMKELCPRAKCVRWEGHTPHIYASTEAFNSGFQGFITSEEMVMITKHAETPQRSPFALRCVNRTYETMISIMHKYPWHATEHITIRERTSIFSCALIQLRVLIGAVSRNSHPQHLHRGLLQEYLTACLSNAGFSVQQKTYMVNCINNEGYSSLLSMIPFTPIDAMVGSWWAFEVLSKNPKSSDPLLTYVVSLLCSATDPEGTFAQTAAGNAESCIEGIDAELAARSSFGYFAVKYPAQNKENCSLKQAAEAEWRALYEALSRVLPSTPALAFGEWNGQQQVAGAEDDAEGRVLALPGLEQRDDVLLG